MWLENDKFTAINHAVVKGEPNGLLRLLGELFHPENQFAKNPYACPKCQKPLEKKMHPYLEYFVQACPDRHGAWMSPEVSAKVRDWVESQISECHRKKKVMHLMILGVVSFLGLFLVLSGPATIKKILSHYHHSKVGAQYWPLRSFEPFVLTVENETIQNPEEKNYLMQIAALLEEGASNRINLDTALKARRTENYAEAFEVYKKNHQKFLMRLQSLFVPPSLNTFQDSLKEAAEAQLAFYGFYVEEKIKHPDTELSQWFPHPALRHCNRELLKAYDFILKQYPTLDTAANHALESRLCWFDIV